MSLTGSLKETYQDIFVDYIPRSANQILQTRVYTLSRRTVEVGYYIL